MMQQVDLLADEFRPRREALTLGQLALGWGAMLGVLGLVSLWQSVAVWQLADSGDERAAELAALSTGNAELRSTVASEPTAELVTEVAALRDRFQDQSLIVEAVAGYERGAEQGFSSYLTDLAAGHVDGMALERIELHDGGRRIVLSGETEAPVNVPRFLRRLSEGPSFQGHRFDEFRLEAQDSGLLRFDIVGPSAERRG